VNRLTPVDVIGQPFAFTQQRLLDAREFERATSERGVALFPGDLERLHRAGFSCRSSLFGDRDGTSIAA
jgi:hypothetical protein